MLPRYRKPGNLNPYFQESLSQNINEVYESDSSFENSKSPSAKSTRKSLNNHDRKSIESESLSASRADLNDAFVDQNSSDKDVSATESDILKEDWFKTKFLLGESIIQDQGKTKATKNTMKSFAFPKKLEKENQN